MNAIGTIWDAHRRNREIDTSWNGNYDLVTKIEDKFWTLEIGIPFVDLGNAKVERDTMWGFNVARMRVEVAEYGEWARTRLGRPQGFGLIVFD